jgi:N-acetylmuramoyl-L-alanine amidase
LFISNRAEERRLSNPAYQDAIVEALFLGIKQYRNNGLLAKSL